MGETSQWCDICVVCALPEEAEAFLEMVEKHYGTLCERKTYDHSKYDYWLAAIKNEKDELLTLHITFPSRYGPNEMVSFLTRVLDENQPRIVIMTGICAGDSHHVQLGDLVVAERTFTYDSGKFIQDKHGKQVHLHDTLTYSMDENILQFLGIFNTWKPLIARLKLPTSPSEHNNSVKEPSSKHKRKVARHLKAMASGTAVRADNPFDDVRIPMRNAVAIDMEGAAVSLVMKKHPRVPWLIVKGVCDFADSNKADGFHEYAAQASALYALSFIRAYITKERLPRLDSPSSSSRAGPSPVWNIPYLRNPHFTGREELLNQLEQHLSPVDQGASGITRRAALTQTQAIKGLGGIGKTQIAVEYAYRSWDLGRYVYTLWVNAASEEALITSFTALAELLPEFPVKDETDQRKLMKEIKRWLEQCKQSWLLIFDNADDLLIIQEYLPQWGNGSILITTRANAVGSLATSLEVETMGLMEGTHLLLRRAQRLESASDEEINEAGNIVVALDHFPLALDQAGAYIEETQCSFVEYLHSYQTHGKDLLALRGLQMTNYPESVATTWLLSFEKVEQANPAAAELLRLCAFLAPDMIPEELIKGGATHWTPLLQQAADELFSFNQMVGTILRFSLVKRLIKKKAFVIHRLVQAVLKEMMDTDMQRQWAERVVRGVNEVFSFKVQEIASWPQSLRYLDQAQTCSDLIDHYELRFVEAGGLLGRTGAYLRQQALYTLAEPLYQRALSILEQQLGPEHPDTVTSLNNLAILYRDQDKHEQAESLLQRALSILEQQLGPEHPHTAIILDNLGTLYRDEGKYEHAEPLLQRALSIRERQLGPEHPDTATSLNNLTTFYRDQSKYEQAESLYQRALSILEQQLGPEHPHTATILNNLGRLYRDEGKYEHAEPLYQRALSILEQQLGPEHPDTATSLNNLAILYRDQSKYKQAESLYQRALSILEQQLGPEHSHTAIPLDNLGTLYRDEGKYEHAEPLLQRALSIRERQLGPEHPDTATSLINLTMLYLAQSKHEQAESFLQRALSILEQQLYPAHPSLAKRLNDLGRLYLIQDKPEQAESLYQRALSILEQQPGPANLDTATSLSNLARLYRAQGKHEQAGPLFQRTLSILEQQLGPEHPSLANPLNDLGILYMDQSKPEQAEPLFQRALSIGEQQLGPEHPSLAMYLTNLGRLYMDQSKYEQAKSLYQRALSIREQRLGPDHRLTRQTRNTLLSLCK